MVSVQATASVRVKSIGLITLTAMLTVGLSPRSSWALEDQAAMPVKKEDAKAQEFHLRVVGPDGKPVPNAEAELRGSEPLPDAQQIRVGTFVKKRMYGTAVKTDAEGRLSVAIKGSPKTWSVSINTPGYGPYWAEWLVEEKAETIPLEFTAELDGGWSVGGIVVDPEGKPVSKATVHAGFEYKKRPGDTRQFGGGGRIQTDEQGKWRYDSVPNSMSDVHISIDNTSFKPFRRPLTRSEFGLEKGQEPSSKIVLDRGLTVTGKVTDETGKPIADAVVRTQFLNEVRQTKTKDDGSYALSGCEPNLTRIVATAKGRAIDLKELRLEPGIAPVNFALKPGGTIRVRVLDHQGRPIPKARIFVQKWRGQHAYNEFRHVNQYANDQGIWIWDEAPPDEFSADICSSDDNSVDLVNQPLKPRAEEYVFRLDPPLIISGHVFDAETKKLIQNFRVTPGVRSTPEHMNWIPSATFSVSNGRYELRRTRGDLAHMVRIEAEGYTAAESRDIKSNEGKVSLDFSLKRGKDIIAKVVTPRNRPAAGAKVAIGIAGAQISIVNGSIDTSSTYCTQVATDEAGRLLFPPQNKPFQIVITHPTGYAHVKSPAGWDNARIIRLEPWARVEGTFRVGKEPKANVPVTINTSSLHSYGKDVPSIFTHHDVITGRDGTFVFERVVAGKGAIGRRIMLTVSDGAADVTSACMIHVDLRGGETNKIDLGGTGGAVIGKLAPPEKFAGKPRWNFAIMTGRPHRKDDANQIDPDGPYISASVDRDGSFRFDDVPPGRYSLSLDFFSDDPIGVFPGTVIEVPPAEGNQSPPPVDLGTLRLK